MGLNKESHASHAMIQGQGNLKSTALSQEILDKAMDLLSYDLRSRWPWWKQEGGSHSSAPLPDQCLRRPGGMVEMIDLASLFNNINTYLLLASSSKMIVSRLPLSISNRGRPTPCACSTIRSTHLGQSELQTGLNFVKASC